MAKEGENVFVLLNEAITLPVITSFNSTSESQSIEECLVGHDWCQPNYSSTTMAWKFASDGTFNYSTTMFGGMSVGNL